MPFGWIDPEVFLTHGDVTIYHVYKDDEIAQGSARILVHNRPVRWGL